MIIETSAFLETMFQTLDDLFASTLNGLEKIKGT
jgi:hypothetical protein